MKWSVTSQHASLCVIPDDSEPTWVAQFSRRNVRLYVMMANRVKNKHDLFQRQDRSQPYDVVGVGRSIDVRRLQWMNTSHRRAIAWIISVVISKLGRSSFTWYCRGSKPPPYNLVSYRSSEAAALARLSIGRND